MAGIGYGHNKNDIQAMAKTYATTFGKTMKSDTSLSNCWFYGFLRHWPVLKVAKPQKLSMVRTESASLERPNNFYKELATILTVNDLHDEPERIFNVDKTVINTEHAPAKIMCSKSTNPQTVTSTKLSTVTIIAGGNALGNNILHIIYSRTKDGTLSF